MTWWTPIASWWGSVQNDLRTIAARGFDGLIEAWTTSILTASDEKGGKDNPMEHRLVKRLLPEFLDEISDAEARIAELDGTIKAATATPDEDEDGGDAGGDEDALSEEEIKALKKKLTERKKKLKGLKGAFVDRLREVQGELSADESERLVVEILKADLRRELGSRVAVHRQSIVAVTENWRDKYQVTLSDLEKIRGAAQVRLERFLNELGYG